MGESIQAMRERRNALAKEVRNVLDQNGPSTWNAEHQKKYDENLEQIERIDAALDREQRLLDASAERTFHDAGGKVQDGQQGNRNPLLSKWLRGGDNALNAADWESVRAATSTTTPAEGGYTVDPTVAAELLKAQKEFGGMFESSTVFSTAKGEAMSWPTMDDTGNEGEIVPENTTATDQDPSFGTVSLNTFKFSSKVVTVPIELLQDSSIDIESVVWALLGERHGRIKNRMFTVGTGTGQPRGIVTAASLGKAGTTGQTLTVTYDDLVDLEHSIDPAYRKAPGVGWMMNDSSLKVIRKIKDTEGRPIFVPGYATGAPGGAPATLLDRKIQINQDVAAMAANAKSILFGNLKNYRIRQVLAATLHRFTDSAYAKKGQVGFLAFSREGGNLLDVSGATVKYYQNSAT
ncbi:phage major capsid protein [Pseudoxanthomonas sp. LjRoot143]|uniref:phage major capsid protein n=1 Tax=Pseudoxanthomonas sp. LjRoot143 TaxID=3342266 RepID=UPI003ED128BD